MEALDRYPWDLTLYCQLNNDATGNPQATVPIGRPTAHPLWSPPGSVGLAVLPALGILCRIAAPSPADLRPGLTADSFAHSLKQSSYRNVDIRDLGLSSSESAGGDQRRGCSGTSASTFVRQLAQRAPSLLTLRCRATPSPRCRAP